MKYLVQLLSEKSGRRSQLPLLLFIDKKIVNVAKHVLLFCNKIVKEVKNCITHCQDNKFLPYLHVFHH